MEISRPIRYLILVTLTVPTLLALVTIAVGIVSGFRFAFPQFAIGTVAILVLLSFPVSVALAFVFPTIKELKLASAINAIPLILAIMWGLFFWLVGIDS